MAGIHPRKRRRQRRHLISISHPRGPFLHPDRASGENLSLSSRKDYMPEKLHTFLMATHGCSPVAVPPALRPGKCVRANGKRQRREKNTRREDKDRGGTRAKEPSVTPATCRNLSSTASVCLVSPPSLPRLRALGVIFQRTGKCSRYREKPPARRCTITYDNIREDESELSFGRGDCARWI